ncbi:MAG: VOC family protein [Pseudomonadales bacterium]|jgi:catechol-2,3-dioxygenase
MAHTTPTMFAHVVYRTRRIAEMLDWYKLVFDAEVHARNPAIAFLSYDGEHHRFAFLDLNVVRPDDTETDKRGLVGVDHVAYTYGSLDDLLDTYERLRDNGVTPYWCVHHGITVSMYYKDPDGNQMEFQVNCFDSGDEAVGYMKGPEFEANPVGVEYDPEDWLARARAGTPATELVNLQVNEPVSPIRGALGE